jgi:hypothetical protein
MNTSIKYLARKNITWNQTLGMDGFDERISIRRYDITWRPAARITISETIKTSKRATRRILIFERVSVTKTD